jgi:hypothetical protein
MRRISWGPFKICFVFNIFFVFLGCSALHCRETLVASLAIPSLSQEEVEQLKLLFRNLFVYEELGYTLFGDKPMSFCFPYTHKPHFTSKYIFKLYREGDVPLAKALAIWKKIGLSRDNYSTVVYENSGYPNCIILINKQSFLNTVNKNIDAFKSIYGNAITADAVLERIEGKIINTDELFQQHLLLGIMLGYGRHSAELFQRRWKLAYGEFKPPFLCQQTTPTHGFASITVELEHITKRLQSKPKQFEWYTNTFSLFLRVTTVPFAFDPDDPEAQALIKKYKNQHAKLTDIFDRSDWLEIVLSKLLQP